MARGLTDVVRTSDAPATAHRRRLDGFDLGIVGLVAASIAWTSLVAHEAGGSAAGPVGLFISVAAAYTAFRLMGARASWLGPASVVVAGAVLAILSVDDLLSAGPLSGPFGYVNAKSAFFAEASIGGLMLALRSGRRPGRALGTAAAAGFAVVPIASRCVAASLLLVSIPPLALLAARRWDARIAVALCAVAFFVALLGTFALAARPSDRGDGPSIERVAETKLSERRVTLWHEALVIMVERPLLGVGPGRFAEESPTARADRDARWAHNGFLQQGAETGFIGLGLLVGLFIWGFIRLASPGGDEVTALGAAALAVLGIHATVDYIFHFAAVPLCATALMASAVRVSSPEAAPAAWDMKTLVRRGAKAAALLPGLATRRRPGDVVILLYHRVGVGRGEIDLPVQVFERQLDTLAARDRVLSLEAALRQNGGGVVLTFDDGYGDFHRHVVPLLVRYRAPAVLYLATSLVEGVDSRSNEDALTWSQLREAVSTGLVTVGAHTHNHKELAHASEAEAEEEMRRSKELIEDRLSLPCRHFAYPFAVGSAAADRAARKLFDSAALHAWKTNRRGRIDPYSLGRTPVLRHDGDFFFRAKVRGLLDPEAVVYRALGRGPWRYR
jgi:peptidoglycan/xylan/chitin deacetylase (PgdA/CDA1 family)/O-antigen ligase